MIRTALYPGTFDPIHYGHIDIVLRASELFENLIVAVYDRPAKNLMFSVKERVSLAQEALMDLPNVSVQPYGGLTVEFAQRVNARAIVRGLRVISDFELEYQMALTNRQLAPNIEFVCLMTRQTHAFISSSIVKEVALLSGEVEGMVPPHVARALEERRRRRERNHEPVPVISLRD